MVLMNAYQKFLFRIYIIYAPVIFIDDNVAISQKHNAQQCLLVKDESLIPMASLAILEFIRCIKGIKINKKVFIILMPWMKLRNLKWFIALKKKTQKNFFSLLFKIFIKNSLSFFFFFFFFF